MWLCIEFLMSILVFALMMLLLSFCVHNLPTGRASAYLPIHLLFIYVCVCLYTNVSQLIADVPHPHQIRSNWTSLKSSLKQISAYPCKIQGFSDDSFHSKNLPKFVSLNWFYVFIYFFRFILMFSRLIVISLFQNEKSFFFSSIFSLSNTSNDANSKAIELNFYEQFFATIV